MDTSILCRGYIGYIYIYCAQEWSFNLTYLWLAGTEGMDKKMGSVVVLGVT